MDQGLDGISRGQRFRRLSSTTLRRRAGVKQAVAAKRSPSWKLRCLEKAGRSELDGHIFIRMEIAAVEGYRSTGRGGRPKFRHEAAKIGDVVSSRMNITTGGTMEFFIYCIAFSLVASIAVGFFIEAGERDE